MKQLRLILLFSLFCTIWAALIGRSASVPSTDLLLLGIPPEVVVMWMRTDESYYKALSSSGAIKCKDGSKKFTKSQLNDDFCDCPDGTDEPGTSACPDGKFYCRNAGHAPLSIFSSKVNDGICGKRSFSIVLFSGKSSITVRLYVVYQIYLWKEMQQVGRAFSSSIPKILLGLDWLAEVLSVHAFRADEKGPWNPVSYIAMFDCCDGSDEYNGKVKCSNTCWEAGKVARDKLKKKIATYQEGVTLRKHEIEQAKLAVAKDEAELSKLKNEEKILKGLVQQLKVLALAEPTHLLEVVFSPFDGFCGRSLMVVKKKKVARVFEHKENIEKAEEKERLQKEKEEKEKKEAEEAHRTKSKDVEEVSSQGKPLESTSDDHIGLLEDSPSDKEHSIDPVHELESADSSGNDDLPTNEVQEGAAKKEEDSSVAHESGPNINVEEKDESENAEALSKEELGRLVASRWTGEVDAGNDDKHEISEDAPSDAHDEEYEGYDSESEDDSQKYNEDDEEEEEEEDHAEDFEEEKHDDFSSPDKSTSDGELDVPDTTTSSSPSWLEKIQQTVRNILQAVNLFQTPVDVSEAARVRREYDESSSKLSKIQSRISSLTKKLNQDFGPDKEFYSFYSKCFEIKQNKLRTSIFLLWVTILSNIIVPLLLVSWAIQILLQLGRSSSRMNLRGHLAVFCSACGKHWIMADSNSDARWDDLLDCRIAESSNWDKFEDSYKAMLFSSGDKCWNGPDRSIKVRLRCGLKNEATDVDEPSRCEYEALLSTPVLCLEEKLKELQEKLDLMNKQQPQGHDEL
ncbi:hypothetical protein RHSIM_Rhsim13G0234500 [Rhododendron simsii]|uniref:Glucosidase 2 subunit beta n=1 Tax=Rhododendron simsii TaxID=118357 RepID=A0A834G6G4_RHOSS|nr:hypothetical protein RHSIM_Rhsim13G0234500 [Rhododendron simsii]